MKFISLGSLTGSVELTVSVGTCATDFRGVSLAGVFSEGFVYAGKDEFIFEKPDPTEHNASRIGNNILFQGRNYEYETGLYYFRARYYHPELGRFLQNDPLGYLDSMNMYQVFNQNPVNFVDPMGLSSDWPSRSGFTFGEMFGAIRYDPEYQAYLKRNADSNAGNNIVEIEASTGDFGDLLSLGHSSYDLVKEPSCANLGWWGADVVSALPFIPSITKYKRGFNAVNDSVDAIKKAEKTVEVANNYERAADALKEGFTFGLKNLDDNCVLLKTDINHSKGGNSSVLL